jgi:hypothetical protein
MRRFAILAVGLTAVIFSGAIRPSVGVAQDGAAARPTEYKAVAVAADEKEATKKLNALLADGWEFVGPLGNGLVVFKRSASYVHELAMKKELAKFEGTWMDDDLSRMTFKGNRWNSGTPTFGPISGTMKIVEVRKGIVLADLEVDQGGQGMVRAIFRIEGDTLNYCGTYADTRPTEFQSTDVNVAYVLKRVPPP